MYRVALENCTVVYAHCIDQDRHICHGLFLATFGVEQGIYRLPAALVTKRVPELTTMPASVVEQSFFLLLL